MIDRATASEGRALIHTALKEVLEDALAGPLLTLPPEHDSESYVRELEALTRDVAALAAAYAVLSRAV